MIDDNEKAAHEAYLRADEWARSPLGTAYPKAEPTSPDEEPEAAKP